MNEKAIELAMGTFLHDWEGTASFAFQCLRNDQHTLGWHEISYATVWEAFETHEVEEVLDYIECLYDGIERLIQELR